MNKLTQHLITNDVVYIGVDYSITSPAICINIENNYYFLNLSKNKNAISDILQKRKNIIISYNDIVYNKNNELNKLEYYIFLADFFIKNIHQVLAQHYSENDYIKIIFLFEHFSYGSKTNTIVELTEAITIFKLMVYNFFKNKKVLFLSIPPNTLKKFIQHGRLTKEEIFKVFLTQPNISKENTQLYQVIKNLTEQNIIKVNKKGVYKIPKPLDDLIDAFYLCEYIKNIN